MKTSPIQPRHWGTILAGMLVLCLPRLIDADTFVLKDGKQVEGVIVKDLGDAYEIENEKGSRQTLKKADVERILPVAKEVAAPLTGASFTFDKKRKLDAVDLLPTIDLKRDVVSGTWKFSGKALTVGDSGHAKLQVTYAPPEEYDLEMVLARKEGADDFFVGLVGGGRLFTFHLDAFRGAWSGPQLVDGTPGGADSALGVPGKRAFPNATARTALFMVRKDGLCVRLDNKDYFVWKGEWTRLSLHPVFIVPNKNALFLGAFASAWSISSIRVTTPKN